MRRQAGCGISYEQMPYVRIGSAPRPAQQRITSKHPFFKGSERLVVRLTDYYLSIRRVGIDYLGRTLRGSPNQLWGSISVTNMGLPTGHFYIDLEDSDEDELIIYLYD